MEELLAAAAEAMDTPQDMVERSAQARAAADGVSIEDVLRAWAGVEGAPAAAPAAPVAAAEPAAPAPAAVPEAAAAPAAAAMDEGSLVAAAAEKMGMPESMVKRSAAARAKAQGVGEMDVLMEWAGVEGAPAPAAVPEAAPAAAAPAAAPPAKELAAAAVVIGEDEADLSPVEEAPPPAFESEEEAARAGAFPRWLAALFVFVPVFAIAYALFLPNGPSCGDAGRLAVDPITGNAVNCDGSAFGEVFVDYFAQGADVYQSAGCVACHGPGGAGVANFPAFTGGALLTTFPEGDCSVQQDWIGLGTAGWPDPTYGANAKPVGGSGAVMPSFAGLLTSDELAAVALYERVAFGGQDLDAGLADCGLGEDAAAAGE